MRSPVSIRRAVAVVLILFLYSMVAGTASPVVPFHLVSPVVNAEAMRIQGAGAYLSFFDGARDDGFLWNNSGNMSLGTSSINSGGFLGLNTNGQERMRIQSSGRIGIGTTLPSYKLHVEDAGIAIHGRRLKQNRFRIASNQPNVEVSWHVTGIRKDPYAEAHRIPVEEDKPADVAGKYLHPEVYGRAAAEAVDYRPLRDLLTR